MKQGIISVKQLRQSEDEQIIADILASILLNGPLGASQEVYDELYTSDSDLAKKVENALAAYSPNRLALELKSTFSVLKDTVESYSTDRYALRKLVNPTSGNPIKNLFYSIFMAFFQLVVQEQKTPADKNEIMKSLHNLNIRITVSAHYATTEDRIKNINITHGLISKYFVHREPPSLGHGPGLIIDFENSIRRSKIESSKYEFKQGILRLSDDRLLDTDLLDRIVETICGIANVDPTSDGFIYFGVCDSQQDAKRVEQLDCVTPLTIGRHHIVGIDREAKVLKKKLEDYLNVIIQHISESALTNPLKTQVLANLDTIDYKGLSVFRVRIPMQDELSFVGKVAFSRVNSSTIKAEGPELLALHRQFQKKTT